MSLPIDDFFRSCDIAWSRPRTILCTLNGPAERRSPIAPASGNARPAGALPANFCERPVLELLGTAAAANPAAIALVGVTERLGYNELLGRVRRIADYLASELKVGEAFAAVLPNAPSGFAALLGGLACGRVCIVLDPAHPPARNSAILRDAKPAAILCLDDEPPAGLELSPRTRLLSVAAALARTTPEHARARINGRTAGPFDPDAPALVHYTSGSTGHPKGIVNSSRTTLRRARLYLDAWRTDASDRLFCATQPSNISGFSANLAALCVGASVITLGLATDGIAALVALCCRDPLTLLDGCPSVVRMLLAADGTAPLFARLRILRSAGESLLQAEVATWRPRLPPGCHIAHAYGSTEAMSVAHWFVPPGFDAGEARLPMGYLLPDQDYALLNRAGHPVAEGEPGELVLRSRDIACGEWQDGSRVPGRFSVETSRPDPAWVDAFGPDASRIGWRVLRTGDLMRLDRDGMLRFHGRADRQIKINGIRVEPLEIEAVLRSEAAVTDVVAVARGSGEDSELLAYVSTAAEHDELAPVLRARLLAELPSPMSSARLVLLPRLPYLQSGKIDANALPPPPDRPAESKVAVEPGSAGRDRVEPMAGHGRGAGNGRTAGDGRTDTASDPAATLIELIAATLKVSPHSLDETSSMHNTPRWDSLRHVLLMTRIETAHGIELSDREMAEATSVGRIRCILTWRGVLAPATADA